MLGFYNYTVWLTYMSLISAVSGIIIALDGTGHPFIGTLCLLICGFCDAFDGKVARTKKNRSEVENKFGIQIDSLSDLVAFGVLPGAVGCSILMVDNVAKGAVSNVATMKYGWIYIAIVVAFSLAALIRLAYFNVMEEERQRTEGGTRKVYEGLPVTASALVFPIVICLAYLFDLDAILLYFGAMIVVGFAFLSKIRIPKPQTKHILIMVLVGAIALAYMSFKGIYL